MTQTQLNHHAKLFFPCCGYCRKIKENVCSENFSGVVEPLKLMAKVKKNTTDKRSSLSGSGEKCFYILNKIDENSTKLFSS
jgi:hypothetical protein